MLNTNTFEGFFGGVRGKESPIEGKCQDLRNFLYLTFEPVPNANSRVPRDFVVITL